MVPFAWPRRALAGGTVAAALVACAAIPRGDVEPRYVAVHNALASMGLAQVGPVQRGSLAEGREARLPLDLAAGCTTIVALGGDGVRDLDVTLVDARGAPIAHDTTRDPQASVRACVDDGGAYALVVRMASGAGDFLAATWSGGVAPGAPAAAAVASSAPAASGTCDGPIPITAGTYAGTTVHGESDNEGSCANSSSREIVYRLDLATRQRVTIDVDPRFDAVLYVRRDDCGDPDAEVACNDDTGHERKSRVDEVLDPGAYFVFVDGYNNDTGAYRMQVTLADVPTLAETCRQAQPLSTALPLTGTTANGFDHAEATCGDGAKGNDALYRLDVAQRSRVRVTEHSDDFSPVVHVRRRCDDDTTEVRCSEDGMSDDDASLTAVLDPGAYTVIADGESREAEGRFTVGAEMAPEQGSGTQGDACGDAIPLGVGHVEGDTFAARDDVAGRCGGAGAADVVYRVDLAHKSRLAVRVSRQEGHHVLVLSRACGDRSAEVACGDRVDETLAPGSYVLAVDGAAPDQLGRFALDVKVRDVAAQETACKAAPTLVAGQIVHGSTHAQGDKFSTSCGGREDAQANPDRVYKLVLGARTHVRLLLTTPTWDGVLVLRKACLDPAGAASARAAEVACNNDFEDARHAKIDATLDGGTYYVVVDGHATGNEGDFTLEYRVVR